MSFRLGAFVCKAKRAVAVVRWVRATAVNTPRRAGMRLCGYAACSMGFFSVVSSTADAAALWSGAAAGVMPEKASSALCSLRLIYN